MIKGKMSVFSLLAVILMASFAQFVLAEDEYGSITGTQLPVKVIKVKINDNLISYEGESITEFKRKNELDIMVQVQGEADLEDVEIIAIVTGEEYEEVSETSETFDVTNNTIYTKDFTLELPSFMETGHYKLRLIVADKNGIERVYRYNMEIAAEKHDIIIEDVALNPAYEVKSGRYLTGVVRVENVGKNEEESVKISISVPELGVKAIDYIDEIDADDAESSEEIFLKIPDCADPGNYDVEVRVDYNRKKDHATQMHSIEVVADETCEAIPTTIPSTPATTTPSVPQTQTPKTVITAGPATQQVTAGEGGVIYPVTILNQGSSAKTYGIAVQGTQDWAEVRASPGTLITVEPNGQETVYLYVAAKEGAEGTRTFSVDVKLGEDILEQISLTSVVISGDSTAGASGKFVKGLQVAIVVLFIILVIVGLILLFTKMKGEGEDEGDFSSDESLNAQTYY
ncbi:hypothetical protein ACFL0W_01640 [Nanoarchaeota archaeon]